MPEVHVCAMLCVSLLVIHLMKPCRVMTITHEANPITVRHPLILMLAWKLESHQPATERRCGVGVVNPEWAWRNCVLASFFY